MNTYLIYLNSKRCIGCHGCEVHCKTNKGLSAGPNLCEISHAPPRSVRGVPRTEFQFRSCYHCADPQCVAVCPTFAMQKRVDGIVFVDQEKCIGCMACQKACLWSIPQFNPLSGKATKCDYCLERVDRGLQPACVSKCTTHALKFARLVEITDNAQD